MSTSPNNGFPSHTLRQDRSSPGEETLRLIGSLPAPEGLADRVKAGLRASAAAPRRRCPSEGRPAPYGAGGRRTTQALSCSTNVRA